MTYHLIPFLVFLLGLSVGSFLNVCIYRLPKGLSIVRPGSSCPACGAFILWSDNIPLLSFLYLRGKCRSCHAPISFRYPAVELATGLIWLGAYLVWGLSGGAVIIVFFLTLLLAIAVTDIETGLIPDVLSVSGMAGGLVAAALLPGMFGEALWYRGLFISFLGLLVGGGVVFLTAWCGEKLFGREAMGGGDLKLMAMAGAFLGPLKVVLAFFGAAFLALPVALYLAARKKETLRYGPFLALSAALIYFFGDRLMVYLGWVR